MSDKTTVWIPKEYHRKLRIEAAERGITLAALLIEIIKKYLGVK